MHTCSTSTSPPSSDQQVWWRDRLDLQHDGVVYMVENFCSRASPTNSREGERKASKAARVWRRVVCDPAGSRICRHDILSIINSGVWAPILTPTHSSMIISDEP